MRLPPLELHAPASAAEAATMLAEHGDDAAVYAGGTELLLVLKLGFGAVRQLVDVKGLAELSGIRVEDGVLAIGAAATHRQLEASAVVAEQLPALAAMERRVANLRVRNAGTLGGNLCFADPHSDPATFLVALDAEVELLGAGGARRLPIEQFVLGPYRTALEPGELLAQVRIPLPHAELAIVHDKLAFRERPAATVTCAVRVAEGRIAEARVAVGSVGPVPVRVREAEETLVGREPAAADLAGAGDLAAAASGAVDDANGAADYKRQLVRVLVRRGLERALGSERVRPA